MISDSFSPPPYELTQTKLGYEFTTALGERYALYLSEAAGYFEGYAFAHHAFMPGLARLSTGKRSRHDSRVEATLLQYIERSFEDRRTVLVYVCDQTDNLQQQRHRLFSRLFDKYGAANYTRRILAEEQTLYAAMLYRQDNPAAPAIESALPELRDKLGF